MPAKKLTAEQRRELAALTALPDDRIDTREMPEVVDWTGAKRGLFNRPGTSARRIDRGNKS